MDGVKELRPSVRIFQHRQDHHIIFAEEGALGLVKSIPYSFNVDGKDDQE